MNENELPPVDVASPSGASAKLDDVARVAGVSAATASRALNGRSGVKADVRSRVEMVADSLDYRPNRAAQRLAAGRSSVIALLMPTSQLQRDPYGAAIVHCIAEAAAALDQGLMIHLAAGQPESAIQRLITDGQVDGVVLSALALDEAWVIQLTESSVPTVLIGHAAEHLSIDSIDTNNFKGATDAVEHLIAHGRTRIAHISGPPDRSDSAERLAGWKQATTNAGIADPSLLEVGDFNLSSGREAAQRLLKRKHVPDAIFAASDEMALGAIDMLHAAELSVPDDIAVIGFDGLRGADAMPSLTTVSQPFAELGRQAVSTLLERIDSSDAAVVGQRIMIDAELITRESCGGAA